MKKRLSALCLAAIAVPAQARNAEDYWCGKGKNRIHLLMWIAKVQEPMRDDEGKLIRDKEGNLVWARAADGRTYSQHGIINHKLPEDHPNWVRVVPERLIRHGAKYNVLFRGQKCTLFTEEDQEKYGVGFFGPRWDLRYPTARKYSTTGMSPLARGCQTSCQSSQTGLTSTCVSVPDTEFKVKVKLPAGTDLDLDAVSQDGKWNHVRSAAIEGEIYNGWVREKFVIDQPCKTSTSSEPAILPPFNPTVTDKP